MNTLKHLVLATLLGLGAVASAQTTNQPPSGLTDFGNTVFGYFTSFNTNLDTTFRDNRFELWLGVDSVQGSTAPLQNSIGISYDVWRPTPATNATTFTAIGIEDQIRNTGVAGTVETDQLGLNFSVVVHDVKLSGYLDGGYDLTQNGVRFSNRLFGEVGLRARKAIGPHFYMGVGVGAQFPRNSQVLSAFTGATF